MSGKFWMAIGALSMGISIGLSAYGAHGLPSYLESNTEFTDIEKRIQRWNTAAQFQTLHSVGLILVGILAAFNASGVSAQPAQPPSTIVVWGLRLAGVLMLTGMLLFSGLLYVSSIRLIDFGGFVPAGGMCLICSWLAMAISVAWFRR